MIFFPLALCMLLAGCGYRWQSDSQLDTPRLTIAVPYITGDGDGSLTGEVVRALGISGIAEVRQSGARYQLQASIVQAENQTIGYRRDRQKISGESKKNLVASEARKTLTVDVALLERDTGKIIRGPFRIEADSDYDYVDGDSIQDLTFISPKGFPIIVLPFSLGQLEPIDAAEEAAIRPLNVRIAKAMTDVIFAEW